MILISRKKFNRTKYIKIRKIELYWKCAYHTRSVVGMGATFHFSTIKLCHECLGLHVKNEFSELEIPLEHISSIVINDKQIWNTLEEEKYIDLNSKKKESNI